MDSQTGTDAELACHDVLLAVAGRLPDRLLWRLRDWLSSGADLALRTAVPRALLRHRIGLTDLERAHLRTAVLAWGGSGRLVDAVLHADAVPEPSATFTPRGEAPGWDGVDLVLRALVPRAGVTVLARAWRTDRVAHGAPTPSPARVVLVTAQGDRHRVAGSVQRALRAQGEHDPRVEVLGPDGVPTIYHRAALAAAEELWRADGPASVSAPGAARTGARERRSGGHGEGATSTAGELVGHG